MNPHALLLIRPKSLAKSLAKSFAKTLVCLCLAIWSAADTPVSWAEEASPSAYPEGSSSIIETRSWQLSGSDLTALHAQAKAAVAEIDEAVLVKEEDGLLVVSLPTQQLSELRERLTALGATYTTREKTDPQAPTTLLRLTFQKPAQKPPQESGSAS